VCPPREDRPQIAKDWRATEYGNGPQIPNIAGNNGASAEGGPAGMFKEIGFFSGVSEALPEVVAKLDE
jgi:hypothetical protein